MATGFAGDMTAVEKAGLATRLAAWARRNMPRREDLEDNRWIGPLARRPELWRFTRRSVPRGVAVGLWVGIFALIPGIQIIGAALMCVPVRGNIPLAALMTFISIPPTTLGLILPGSIWVGNQFGFHADYSTVLQLYDRGAGLREWLGWMLSDAAPSLLIGLFVISTVVAVVGYFVSSVVWNWWVRRKRHTMIERMRARRAALGDG